ncbi:choice-of-anchor Q domain-containing protein [Viscerimonas tarda]
MEAKKFLSLALIALLTLMSSTAQNIRYVKPDGTGNGTTWELASNDLQAIINLSDVGDRIWMAKGAYTAPAGNGFVLKEGVSIYGGFTGDETELYLAPDTVNNKTILKSEGNGRVLTQLANFGADTECAGLIITGGNATNAVFEPKNGGGAYIMGGTTLRYCIVKNNVASFSTVGNGGGIYNNTGTIVNCVVSYNKGSSAIGYGGGICNLGLLLNSIISDNLGGGLGIGGGIFNTRTFSGQEKTGVVSNCLIFNNTAGEVGNTGGGVVNLSILINSTIVNNCGVIDDKSVSANIGGVYNDGGPSGGGFAYNNIIWGNTDIDISIYDGGTVKNNIFKNVSIETEPFVFTDGNSNADPQFVDVENGDFRLQASSPAIDAGNNLYYDLVQYGNKDVSNNKRIEFGTIDLGAYELQNLSLTKMPASDNLSYFIQNGYLYFTDENNKGIVLYNTNGQYIRQSSVNNILLPQRGIYIVKVNFDGKEKFLKIIW